MAEKEWVLITGAASGIGAELCRLFARDGSHIVLIDQNQQGLETMSASLSTSSACRLFLWFRISRIPKRRNRFIKICKVGE
jgi:short-subunit dehydrogenase